LAQKILGLYSTKLENCKTETLLCYHICKKEWNVHAHGRHWQLTILQQSTVSENEKSVTVNQNVNGQWCPSWKEISYPDKKKPPNKLHFK